MAYPVESILASRLIERLTKLIEEHGDLQVRFDDDNYGHIFNISGAELSRDLDGFLLKQKD